MQCPICHHDMIHSNAGWLCMNCGHVEAATTPAPAPEAAPAPTTDPVKPPPTPAAAEVPPAPIAPVAPSVPVVPATMATPPLQPMTHPKKRSKLLLIGLPVLILIIAAVGFYGWWWQPHMALASYLTRLSDAKTAVFSGSATSESTDPTTTVTIKMSGHYDITDQANPKADITLSGQVRSNGSDSLIGSGSVGGEALFTDQTAYLKITDLSILSSLVTFTPKPTWYKYSLPKTQQTNNCVSSDKKSSQLLGTTVVTNVPLTKVHRVGIFETVNGHQTSHYVGTIDMAKLPAAIKPANQSLSAACQIDLSPDDYKNLTISYDLWDSSAFDRMVLAISDSSSKTRTTVTLDTSAYNKPVTITAPSGVKDISELYSDILGSVTAAQTNPNLTTQ